MPCLFAAEQPKKIPHNLFFFTKTNLHTEQRTENPPMSSPPPKKKKKLNLWVIQQSTCLFCSQQMTEFLTQVLNKTTGFWLLGWWLVFNGLTLNFVQTYISTKVFPRRYRYRRRTRTHRPLQSAADWRFSFLSGMFDSYWIDRHKVLYTHFW